jgi:hypothetical protein|tara:strand:- start:130 stop:267 length:138 start_codon:yes stop_codon:yes gene_type:complete
MPRLQEVKGRYFITVSKGLVERKKWIKGQELYFVFNERGEISIKD